MAVSSWSYPNLFDVARSKINLYVDATSVVNRVKLLLLTEPTELYMVPNFGVGLKKYMFTYNNDNTIAMIRDALIEQLRLWEPDVVPEETKVERGSNYTTDPNADLSVLNLNKLSLTITLTLADMHVVSFDVSQKMDNVV